MLLLIQHKFLCQQMTSAEYFWRWLEWRTAVRETHWDYKQAGDENLGARSVLLSLISSHFWLAQPGCEGNSPLESAHLGITGQEQGGAIGSCHWHQRNLAAYWGPHEFTHEGSAGNQIWLPIWLHLPPLSSTFIVFQPCWPSHDVLTFPTCPHLRGPLPPGTFSLREPQDSIFPFPSLCSNAVDSEWPSLTPSPV